MYVTFAGKQYCAVVAAITNTPNIDPAKILPIDTLSTGLERVLPTELELWHFIASYYLCTVGEVMKTAYPALRLENEYASVRRQKRLEQLQHRITGRINARISTLRTRIDSREASLMRRHTDAVRERIEAEITSLREQIEALEHQLADNADMTSIDSPRTFLPTCKAATIPQDLAQMLEKGKTVLLRSRNTLQILSGCIAKTLAAGKSVLLLEAEIEMCQMLKQRLEEQFADQILLYNSSESAAARRTVSEKLREGTAWIVIGTHSAIFLPFKKLGLVAVNNEHSTSYKRDVTPRYNGRDMAAVLARIHSAQLILCSFTPSLDTVFNVICGKYLVYDDTREAGEAIPGQAVIIDTSAEKRKNGMVGNFSRKLMAMMDRELTIGKKVMLLRAWGDTAAIEDETKQLFPGYRTERLDKQNLDTYASEAQILISTIYATKNFDFSSLSLVVLMQSDGLFSRADFRADERALQLLCQFGINHKGQFAIQTARSSHPVYKALARGYSNSIEYDAIIGKLMEERQSIDLPPYSRLIDILIRDKSSSRIQFLTSKLAAVLEGKCKQVGECHLLGSFPVYSPEDNTLCIRLVLTRGKKAETLKQEIRSTVEKFEKEHSYRSHIHFDVDPV